MDVRSDRFVFVLKGLAAVWEFSWKQGLSEITLASQHTMMLLVDRQQGKSPERALDRYQRKTG